MSGVARPALLDELAERSIVDIAREVESLRNENARLKEEVSRLAQELATQTPELLRYKKEHTVFEGAVKSLMREGGFLRPVAPNSPLNINALPPEILLRIFSATKSPLYEHDPSIVRGRNPWLGEIRFRKGLVLVCKAWSWPATAILYEDIVLREMGQILALARTLSSGGTRDFCGLIHHLRMDSCVVWAPCTVVIREDLLAILQQCVALRSLSFHPHPHFPDANHAADVSGGWEGLNPTWFVQDHSDGFGQALQSRLSSGLRELDIASTLSETQVVELHKLLTSAQSLRSLKIGPVAVSGTLQDAITVLETLILPALSELQLHVNHTAFITLVSSRWKMPSLKSVTALACPALPEELLRSHGRSLTYLNICPKKKSGAYDHRWEPCEATALRELPELCPVLDHFVFPASKPTTTAADILANAFPPTLRYLDIWCHTCDAPRARIESECQRMVHGGNSPALVRIRRLRRIVYPDLPLICHPSLVSGDEMRIHRFPRAYVLQTSWAVLPDGESHSNIPWFVNLPEDEDDDPRYVDPDDSWDDEDSEDEDEEGEEEGEEEDDDEASSPATDETPYDPFNDESGSESSSESDSDVDRDIDAEISDWELDIVALRQEQLNAQYDRATVLELFRSTQMVSDPSDDEDAMSVDDDDD
ncbi:hypothetical protein K466DRAFT_659884 [Polyporus arcularius HHB13444]|uniref:F-box domain-containing protein n=1 Tax=Polyporus arcularius HHB13444 TaxID=1314778 RepID=A0A5C3PPQ3_9APHY|nr:hypothetical protein K466DRAFT_659884 [Polyporus arcularius HHB13444]